MAGNDDTIDKGKVFGPTRWGKPSRVSLPDGFDDEQDFLRCLRTDFDLDIGADNLNRMAAVEDMQFLAGEQWETSAKARRESARRPVITINRIPAFVAQLVGNRRLNELAVKVTPDNGGTKEIAAIREGLVRSIQKNSNADVAYDKAFENAVSCGIGNWQVAVNWADGDVFDQDIAIEPIPNAMAVVWDRASIIPSGRDAGHCFVVETMSQDMFKRRWPKAEGGAPDVTMDTAYVGAGVGAGWWTQDAVRIVDYWRMCYKKRELALMSDGRVQDITDVPDEAIPELLGQIATGNDGVPIVRESEVPYAEMWKCTGNEILEGPYRMDIDRVPVFRVQGWEVNVGEQRMRWGLVRFLKDPMRLHNYWRSVIAERLLMAPKAKWVAAKQSIEGNEKQWREAHLSDDSVLTYDAEQGPQPTFTPPIVIEPGLVQFAEMAVQDIRDVSNIHEASLGVQSNEVSGKAIIARQRVGELGSVGYNDNCNDAIRETGRVIDQLIPSVYNTPRTIMVIGEDGDASLQAINQAGLPDITEGKYKISFTAGPSYVTKRVEAAESMLNMVNAMPQTMAIAADKIVEAQDWPGSSEIARRLRLTLPPGMVDEKDMTPQQREQQAGEQQAQAVQAQLAQQMATFELQLKEAQVAEARAKARLALAQARKAESEIGVQADKVEVDVMRARNEAADNRATNALRAVELAYPEPREKMNESGRE